MLRRKITESLTLRIFLITALILLGAGAVTFGLVAWATPSTYFAVIHGDLDAQVDALTKELSETAFADCGPVLDQFLRNSGADAMLVDSGGEIVGTNSQFAVQPAKDGGTAVLKTPDDSAVSYSSEKESAEDTVTVTLSEVNTVAAEVYFADRAHPYTLYVTPRMEQKNPAVRALIQMAPCILLVLLAFSLLCALVYSRYITHPIVRLSGIAGKMAELDFHWKCAERRQDEIGALGRSLNRMAGRLSAALSQLETANRALQDEVARERELDRQRMAFFSAASHELKTPVTILKGQLTGMLEGIGVYQNREKYLLRALRVTGRMEALTSEMLSISRMESGSLSFRQEPLELAVLIGRQLALDTGLLEQRGQRLVSSLTPDITVTGDSSLLAKAVGNLLSNASLYSPSGAEIRVWCGLMEGLPALTVENTNAQIGEESLPHLFEAFFREEDSRSRSTGGSGLGLYLVKMILDRHGASCEIANSADGVMAVVRFPRTAQPPSPARQRPSAPQRH